MQKQWKICLVGALILGASVGSSTIAEPQDEAAFVRDEINWHLRSEIVDWPVPPPDSLQNHLIARAQEYGVDLKTDYGARFYQHLARRKNNQINPSTPDKGLAVARHILIGQGNPLPPKEKIEAEERAYYKLKSETRERDTPPTNEQVGDEDEGLTVGQELLRELTPETLPTCEKPAIASVENQYQFVKGSKEVRFDLLYLKGDPDKSSSGARKFDYQELFGRKASVWFYTTNPADVYSLQVAKNGGTCLPFRIRVTAEKVYFLAGDAALKNYDQDENGKLHPSVKQEIDLFM
jgi:hypothetical protein